MNQLLKLTEINFSYHTLSGETKVLNNVSFEVNSNEFVGIIGSSGSGKSTILSLIFGLLVPDEGEIQMNNQTSVGYMLQKDHLLEWRSVYKNITLGLEINKQLTNEKEELIEQMLSDYGLSGFKDAKPSQLSGGMRQRAALIRTLALQPDLLLLDEPFSSLDYQTRLSVADDIFSILRKEGKSAIMVTHDLSEALSFCDRIIVLSKRPGTIKKNVPIVFSIDNKTPLAARNAPEFRKYFNLLWGELNVSE